MNYDSRYKGGAHESEFWSNFDFKFDDDELAFLRPPQRGAEPTLQGLGREWADRDTWP